MYAARPKSSKGRTRPKIAHAQSLAESLCPNPTFSPRPPPSSKTTDRFDAIVRPRTVLRQSSKPSVLTEIYEKPPDVPPVPSLNKYRVLPSIDKRPEGSASIRSLEKKVLALSLAGESVPDWRLQRSGSSQSDAEIAGSTARKRHSSSEVPPFRVTTGHSENEEPLLLAVRSPCGRRVECRFRPSDTLRDVVAAAEASSGLQYENATIETMEVPRRTFSNLSVTLSDCGIVNKSVLCVSLEDDTTDSN